MLIINEASVISGFLALRISSLLANQSFLTHVTFLGTT